MQSGGWKGLQNVPSTLWNTATTATFLPFSSVRSDQNGLPELFIPNPYLASGVQYENEREARTGQQVTAAAFIAPGVAALPFRGAGSFSVVPRIVSGRASTLTPGPFAAESIPARGPGRINSVEQSQINQIGNKFGCHTCGTANPGTKSGNWVGDHQPPSRLVPAGAPQRLFPHCLRCSASQGGTVNRVLR